MISTVARMFPRSVSLLRPQQHYVPVRPFCPIKQKMSLLPESSLQRFGISSYRQPNEKETSHSYGEWFEFSSFVSPQPNEEETFKSHGEQGRAAEKASAYANSHILDEKDESRYVRTKNVLSRRRTKQNAFSPSEDDLELVKLVLDKEELRKLNHELVKKELEAIQIYGDTMDLIEKLKTKQKGENSKNSIQNFVKVHLDVSDNLGWASSVVKENLSKIYSSKDAAEAVPLQKMLLKLVEMIDKQLAQVFKKLGVEKFHPTNVQFDPDKHNAVFPVPDQEKAPDAVAICVTPGHSLHGQIIRPAEVGLTGSNGKYRGQSKYQHLNGRL